MSRGLSTAVADALKADVVRPVTFAKLDFSSSTIYVHDSIGTFTWGGNDWLGVGDFGSVSSIEEGTDISPYSITLTLSGLDSTIANIGSAGTEDYFMRDVDIYLGLLDEDESLIADPTAIWSGFMDVMTLVTGTQGSNSIRLTCESEMSKIERSADLKYTHVQQQRVNPNDLFFEYLHEIQGVKIQWKDMSSGNLGVGRSGSGDPAPPGRCLVAGTRVKTPSGEVPIESLKAGDIVLGANGENKVLSAGCYTGQEHQFVDINNGLIRMTSTHPLMTTEGWSALDVVEAKKLQADDMEIIPLVEGLELLMRDGDPVVIDTLHTTTGVATVYTIKVNNDHTYIANGIVTHNK